MRLVIAIPVLGLLAGAVAGVRWSGLPAFVPLAVLIGWLALAFHAIRVGSALLLSISVCGAFAAGGFALAVDAWQKAWRPSLRVEFDRVVQSGRGRAVRSAVATDDRGFADGAAVVVLEGVLRTDAVLSASGAVSLSLRVDRVAFEQDARNSAGGSERHAGRGLKAVDGGVLLTVGGELAPLRMSEWTAGRRIRAPALLRRAPRYLDPGVPDQERALARRGTILVGSVKSGALVDLVARGGLAAEWAAAVRAYARGAVDASVGTWRARSAGIVRAILIGDRTGLASDVERRLQEAGTYHVIAISGGNVAILAAIALGAFRVVGWLGRAAMFGTAAGLAVYGYIVVGGASVTRATLMAIAYFVGRALDLAGPPLHGLLLVAGIMVIADPLAIVDVASLLSFGATLAIIWVASAVPFKGVPRVLVPAAGLAAASAAAEAALFPISAAIFQRVTVAGLVLNFGAIPLMSLAQLAGMAAIPMHVVSPWLSSFCGYAAHLGAEGLVRTAELVALVPWSTWRVPSPVPWVVVLYYGSWAGVLALRRRRAVTAVRVCGGAAVAAAGWMLGVSTIAARPSAEGRLRVTFIDVGQGDAAVVQFPAGSAMLVDAGGLTGTAAFDIGDRVVGPVLRSLGVHRLDAVVLTHGDADHAGGMSAVLHDFRPWDLWEGVPVPHDELLQVLRREAAEKRIRWTTVQTGDRVSIDDVEVLVHHPRVPDWERQKVRNDDSVVVELRWGEASVVFTGDIGRDVEREIAPQFSRSRLRVVKVPHHGSATSSSEALVEALAPAVAVVSVGRGNRFGHPVPLVLERYRRSGAAVFRTDRDGAVTIDTDGTGLDVHTYTGRSMHLAPAAHRPAAHGGAGR
ncbi:MAG: DNA internalization-related competence protein ComEC/Rec2 [Vicinamibacterales bacterium]